MEESYAEQARVFKAVCDENRLKILSLLRKGEKCACVLLEKLDMGQSGLSYHMKILVESGIVTSRQEGKWVHYRISGTGSAQAVRLLQALTTPDAVQEANACSKQAPACADQS
ncbi:MAG: metalloregulator ArsR/SmtB family transcription factor [Candidatus Limiplasma sp.]|nr:metalloregulator ArsR/SmtB family transcription factor [Candidatus Limiplasma sp.]